MSVVMLARVLATKGDVGFESETAAAELESDLPDAQISEITQIIKIHKWSTIRFNTAAGPGLT